MKQVFSRLACVVAVCGTLCAPAAGRQLPVSQERATGNGTPVASATVPGDYVIGPQDVLSIVFWREKDLSADVVVRPDGKISLPLLKDLQAAGYTPEQLTEALLKAASKFISQPNATVYGQYLYYFYDFQRNAQPPTGIPAGLERNGVRTGFTLWVPALRR